MSVNEVKLQKAPEPLVIKGTGPRSSRTFCIGDEDHTLGNSVRHVLIRNQKVGFAGYSVPHPSEPVVHVRVQTVDEQLSAVETLKEASQTLSDQCDIVLQRLEELLPDVQEDRLNMEKLLMEEGLEGEDNQSYGDGH